jgi:hypothetical protein
MTAGQTDTCVPYLSSSSTCSARTSPSTILRHLDLILILPSGHPLLSGPQDIHQKKTA